MKWGEYAATIYFSLSFLVFSIVPLSGLRGEVGESRGRERRKKQEGGGEQGRGG